MYLQQANDNYAMLELQLEINHCIDGQYRIVSRHGNSYYTQDQATTQQGPIPNTTKAYMQLVITQFPPSCLILSTSNGFDELLYQTINTQLSNGYDYALFIQPNNTRIDQRWLTLRKTHKALYYYTPELLVLTSSDKIIDHLDRAKPRIKAEGAWNTTAASVISQAITDHILTYPVIATSTDDIDTTAPATTAPATPTASAKPIAAPTKGRGKGKRSKKVLPPNYTPAEPETPRPPREPTPYDECLACRGNQSKYDERHTRIPGKCKYWDVETPKWTCPGCIARSGRWTEDHNYKPGECKHYDMSARVSTTKQRGRYPAVPVQKATADPTAGLRPTNPGGELGLADATREVAKQEAASSSSSSSSAQPPQPASSSTSEPTSEPADTSSEPRAARGPDTYQRTRRTFEEASTTTDQPPTNWSRFDIHLTAKALRTADEAARRRLLRKLHLRWWHATAAQMKTLLKAANQPPSVIQLVDDIVATCEVCRTWTRPQAHPVSTVSLSTRFNEQVEADIVFFQKKMIFHMICRCIRWHAAKEIEDNKTPTLLDAITEIWLQHHGAPKEFLMDGERGVAVSHEAKEFFDNHSIKLTVRATGKHCHFIEKRGDLLKTQLRKLDTSCKQEGISIPFPRLLAEAVFAGNALISINQTTPYNALYGRVPNILPDINHVPQPSTRDAPEQIRHANRLREILHSRMVETTAEQRIERAMETRTRACAQEAFDLCDHVDFYRKPDQKNVPGWSGPAKSQANREINIVWHHSTILAHKLPNTSTLFWQTDHLRQHCI